MTNPGCPVCAHPMMKAEASGGVAVWWCEKCGTIAPFRDEYDDQIKRCTFMADMIGRGCIATSIRYGINPRGLFFVDLPQMA